MTDSDLERVVGIIRRCGKAKAESRKRKSETRKVENRKRKSGGRKREINPPLTPPRRGTGIALQKAES
jgi:hypothetical protein